MGAGQTHLWGSSPSIVYVVHCVRVPLTSTIVAEFWACGGLIGIGLCTFSYYVYNIVDIGGASIIVV